MERIPAVSVLMPVRNEERYLRQALASLQAQKFTDWELVAVDDGSSDATVSILRGAADSRVRVLSSPERGLVPALNHGLAACRALFVARMDGDDISHPERLAKQYAFLASNPATGLVASSFCHFPRQGLKVGMLAYEKWQNSLANHELITADLFVESPFVHPSVMFRRDAVTAAGGYRAMGWPEDYDLWLRLAAAGIRFARICEPLFFWRDRPERATRTMAEYSQEAFRACKLHHLKKGFLAGEDQVVLAGAGKEGRAWRRILEAMGISVFLWVDVDPRKAGRMLHGAMIKSPAEFDLSGRKMLITVGTRGAREGIRSWATGSGYCEGKDFVCVT